MRQDIPGINTTAIICDLDGTLCNHKHRLHFVDLEWFHDVTRKEWKPDYEAFYAAMEKDTVYEWCSDLLYSMYLNMVHILFVTARPERFRKITERWLRSNMADLGRFQLFMRPDYLCSTFHRGDEKIVWDGRGEAPPEVTDKKKDYRPTPIVKREIYTQQIEPKYHVLFVVEDDPDSVQMYRSLALPVLMIM